MGTKNGICPYCQFTRFENRVFPVNPEASTVFCPFCMRELSPKKSIELYNNIINGMLDKADSTLFVACDPSLAYHQYADVLEIEANNPRALLGRILCLIYTSKVRHSYLIEANTLLENITYKGSEEAGAFVGFLKKINFALDEYEAALKKKLSNHRELFYDADCLRLYLKHLYDIIKFKKDMLKNLNDIKRDYITQRNDVMINLVSHSISEKELSLRTVKFTTDGKGYKLTKVFGDKAYIDLSGDFVDTRSNKHKQYTLESGVKGKRYIKELAFKDYTPILNLKRLSLYLSIILFVLAIGAGVSCYIFKDNNLIFIITLIAGAVLLVGAIVFIIIHFIWRRILKKRKMRID